jgi:hypothetical protein
MPASPSSRGHDMVLSGSPGPGWGCRRRSIWCMGGSIIPQSMISRNVREAYT